VWLFAYIVHTVSVRTLVVPNFKDSNLSDWITLDEEIRETVIYPDSNRETEVATNEVLLGGDYCAVVKKVVLKVDASLQKTSKKKWDNMLILSLVPQSENQCQQQSTRLYFNSFSYQKPYEVFFVMFMLLIVLVT
jgi:hypothetical protein